MMVKPGARGRSAGPGAAGPRGGWFAAGALALLVAGTAEAHPEFSAIGSNRYVTAAVFDGRVDVTDAVLEGTLTGAEHRARMDTDHDGSLSDDERTREEQRQRAAAATLAVAVDGRARTAVPSVFIDLGDEPRVTAAPVVVERRATLWLGDGPPERRLRLSLLRDPDRLLETEVGVVLGPGLTLHAPSDGAAAPLGSDRFVFQGPRTSALQERSATFVLAVAPPARGPSFGKAPLAAGVLLLGAAVTAVLWARRRPPA